MLISNGKKTTYEDKQNKLYYLTLISIKYNFSYTKSLFLFCFDCLTKSIYSLTVFVMTYFISAWRESADVVRLFGIHEL